MFPSLSFTSQIFTDYLNIITENKSEAGCQKKITKMTQNVGILIQANILITN